MKASMWLSPFIWVWSGVPGHTKSNFQYSTCNMSRLNWAMMVIFGLWIAIDRKKELIQLFQGVQQSGSWLLASKFSRPIRFFVFFNINITRMAWSFDFIVFKAVLYHVWNLTNNFWSLIDCGIYCTCPFKSVLLKLSQITQKILLTSCLIVTVRLEDFKILNSRTELWKSEYFRQMRHKISVLFRKLLSKHLLVQSQQYKN